MFALQEKEIEITKKTTELINEVKLKVKQSRYRPGLAQGFLGGYDYQISLQRHRMVAGCQPYAPATFTPKKFSWYSFLFEAESTPGP